MEMNRNLVAKYLDILLISGSGGDAGDRCCQSILSLPSGSYLLDAGILF